MFTHKKNCKDADYILVSKSKLFDKKWYLKKYKCIIEKDTDPIEHYLKTGWKKNLDPSKFFSTSLYLNTYFDVKCSGMNPLVHYLRYGKKEGKIINNVKLSSIDLFIGKLISFFYKEKTILIISHEFTYTGAPLSLLQAAQELKKYGYKITTISLSDGPLKKEFLALGQVRITNNLKHIYFISKKNALAIINTIVLYKVYDILKENLPTVWWIREPISYLDKNPDIIPTLKQAKNVYTMSELSQKEFLQYNPNIKIIKHGIIDQYKKHRLQYDPLVFAVIGSICERKGQDIFIKAVNSIPRNIKNNTKFLIVGKKAEPKYYNYLKSISQESIEFVDEISNKDELLTLYSNVSCVVIPSKEEPTSRVAIESMMMGRPVIMSENVGAQYLLESSKNGYIFHNNENELAHILEKIIKAPEILKSMEAPARNAYIKNNSISVFRENLLKMITMTEHDFYKDKILVHLHLYYHSQIHYFLKRLKNITCYYDLYVTYTEENEDSFKLIKSLKPDAHLMKVKNIGYDVYPFWQVLQKVNLDSYKYILKVHTKNYRSSFFVVNNHKHYGYEWRNALVDSLLGSKRIFNKNIKTLKSPEIGMIASANLIKHPQKSIDKTFDSVLKPLMLNLLNIDLQPSPFVCGTMFIVKSQLLHPFKNLLLNDTYFNCIPSTGSSNSLAHSLERYLCYIVKQQNKTIFGRNIFKIYYSSIFFSLKLFAHKLFISHLSDKHIIKYSNFFDKKFYLTHNPDVKNSNMSPYKHYLQFGWREGRNPSSIFNGNTYLLLNKDVANAHICPLLHYEKYGIFEGRNYSNISNIGLNFRNYSQLYEDIYTNYKNIKERYDIIVGIPRSGMIPACILGYLLNIEVMSIDEFISTHVSNPKFNLNILLVDDSINSGHSLTRVKDKLSIYKKVSTLAIYASPTSLDKVDYYFCLLPQPRVFEWNFLNHIFCSSWAYDIDGVLCKDPLPFQNDDGKAYREFILNAEPLFIPNHKIGVLATARLEKYRPETECWLKKHNIKYDHLLMLDLPSKEERQKLKAHTIPKIEAINRQDINAFVESSYMEAQIIAKNTNKPVICTETFELIGQTNSIINKKPTIIDQAKIEMLNFIHSNSLEFDLVIFNSNCKRIMSYMLGLLLNKQVLPLSLFNTETNLILSDRISASVNLFKYKKALFINDNGTFVIKDIDPI